MAERARVRDVEWALQQIMTTDRPVAEIASECGCTEQALEARLRRRYGQRSRGLRGGRSAPGRPPQGRQRWSVRLTPDERAEVESAIAREREAGAQTPGEALARAVQVGKRRSV